MSALAKLQAIATALTDIISKTAEATSALTALATFLSTY